MNRPRLDERQRRQLLKMARQSIEDHLAHRSPTVITNLDAALGNPGAAFVTLRRAQELRGCVGYIEPLYPLWETVSRCAVAAASEDHRFHPVTLLELPRLEIAVSVLTPVEPMRDLSGLEIGRHGLMVRHGARRGLLLPEVACERAWDGKTFLRETCRKAGLGQEVLEDPGLEIFLFETERFCETDGDAVLRLGTPLRKDAK